jgi:hypothetical protein
MPAIGGSRAMKKPFPLLALILAFLVGPRAVHRVDKSAASASGVASTAVKTHSQRDDQRTSHAVMAAAREGCREITLAELARRWWLMPAANRCSVVVSPIWKEIYKINPNNYSENEVMAENLTGQDFKNKCIGDPAVVQSMMAAVPNPQRTHLGLMTDRAIEAIQVAASEAGFMPLAHYLPWPSGNAGSSGGDGTGAGESEPESNTPGVLVFQNSDDSVKTRPRYLLVFLIPETPTEGLDEIAFGKAGRLIQEISIPQENTIRFVGPSFSGSVARLGKMQKSLGETFNPIIYAVSGSVTNQPPISEDRVQFTPIQTNDQEALCRFVRGARAFGYQSNEIAILSEEGTQYGRQGPTESVPVGSGNGNANSRISNSDPCANQDKTTKEVWQNLWFLHFPREISKLRNAYGAEVGKSVPADLGSSPDLGLQWQDAEGSQHDDLLTYGGRKTPLSQEAVLSTLSITLKAQGIKALGILATDPMDEAFLIHSIKRSSPDVRLFVRDPDLLFLRTPDVGTLNGTLLVSNYPLVPENQFWMPSEHEGDTEKGTENPSINSNKSAKAAELARDHKKAEQDHHLITFPSAFQEGEYNAFVELLQRANWAPKDMEKLEWDWPMGMSADGGQPTEAGKLYDPNSPRPLWLAVIGTAGHYPIKILNPRTVDRSKLKLHSLDLGKPQFVPVALWAMIAMLGLLQVLGLKYQKAVPPIFKHDFDVSDNASSVSLVKHACHMLAILTVMLSQLILGSSFLFFCGSGARYTTLACMVLVVTGSLIIAAGIELKKIYVLAGQQQGLSSPSEANQILKPRRILWSSSSPPSSWLWRERFGYG